MDFNLLAQKEVVHFFLLTQKEGEFLLGAAKKTFPTHPPLILNGHYLIFHGKVGSALHQYTYLRYQNRFSHYCPFDIHFNIFSVPNYFKMYEVYVFCGEQCQKLEHLLLFCFELDAFSLLRRREIVTVHENSRDFLLRRHGGRHSCRHLLNKTCV